MSTSTTATRTNSSDKTLFENLVLEELPLQRASVEMESGMPSCIKLFDRYLSCHSINQQITSLYQQGSTKPCSDRFKDFKFCLSLKDLTSEEKDEIWARRRAEAWAKRRLSQASSEMVWEARKNVYSDQSKEQIKRMLGKETRNPLE